MVRSEVSASLISPMAGDFLMSRCSPQNRREDGKRDDSRCWMLAVLFPSATTGTAAGVGSLEKHFSPNIEADDRQKAEIDGWILGVL